jgi:hypothetical protein
MAQMMPPAYLEPTAWHIYTTNYVATAVREGQAVLG